MAPKYERREFARRDFIAGALATGVVSAVATYLTPGGRSTPPVEIRFVTGTDETGARALLVQMWNRANPGATVDVDLVQGSTADQSKAMLDKVASGAADVLNLDVIDIPTFHERKLISPVEIEDVNGFLPSCLLTSTLGGSDPPVRWAVPFNADVGMLFR